MSRKISLGQNPEVIGCNAVERYNIHKQSLKDCLGNWCDFCGEQDDIVLQFNHNPPILRGQHGSSWLKELNNINPFLIQRLCANCHVRLTDVQNVKHFGGGGIVMESMQILKQTTVFDWGGET